MGPVSALRPAAGSALGACALALVVAGVFLASAFPRPAEGQGAGVFRGVLRPITRSHTAIVSEPQRFRVRPKLVIDPGHRAGATEALFAGGARRMVLAVHRDGVAHLWDLGRGVRVGGEFAAGVVAGVVRGTGNPAEVVAVHRDGSVSARRLDGAQRTLGARIRDFDARAAPTLSADGTTMVFRTRNGRWHVAAVGAAAATLPKAAREARPILSPNGSAVAWRTSGGALVAGRVTSSGVRVLGPIDGCKRGAAVTAGVFSPLGSRILLGDARGRLCVWTIAGTDAPKRLFSVRTKGLRGGVDAVATNRDGTRAAARAANGTVEVWTMSGRIRRLASIKLSPGTSRPLSLDSARRWVFAGEADGTIAIHSYRRRKSEPVGWLISSARGWTVLDHAGRFDGSQGGIDALTWSGETATRIRQDLPVDAFSESYFEPGLLAKLSSAGRGRADYLTAAVDDLSREGYLRPPRVAIDPISVSGQFAGEPVTVTVRVAESDYPMALLSEIRLYHNDKLVPDGRTGKPDGVERFTVRLAPGRNELRALAVGTRGIEGPPSPVRTVSVSSAPARPDLRLVSIGINDYVQPAWELFYARNDAKTLVSSLRERGGGLFGDVHAATLLDASADRPGIEAEILDASTSPRDVLVVYFSGHGYAFREKGRWEWYLLPFTREWGRKAASQAEHEEQIRRHGLSSRKLMQLLTRAHAQRVFLVLDSCRSGAVVGTLEALSRSDSAELDDSVAQKSLRRLARVGGIHVLAASRAQEDATELQVVPHGALTYLVIEGIRGAADDARDGRITVREIVDYAAREMPTLARRLVQEPISQTPVGYSRGADFALAEF